VGSIPIVSTKPPGHSIAAGPGGRSGRSALRENSARHSGAPLLTMVLEGTAGVSTWPRESIVQSLAWRHEFKVRSWSDLLAFYEDMASRNPEFGYLVDIVRSIEASPNGNHLAATTSMHDLVVIDRPIPEPPAEVLRVSAPGSPNPAARDGWLAIEHHSHSGRNDRIERPVSEAVSLFWRFVLEKFGIEGRPAPEVEL
jgi:hypothetical protein